MLLYQKHGQYLLVNRFQRTARDDECNVIIVKAFVFLCVNDYVLPINMSRHITSPRFQSMGAAASSLNWLNSSHTFASIIACVVASSKVTP